MPPGHPGSRDTRASEPVQQPGQLCLVQPGERELGGRRGLAGNAAVAGGEGAQLGQVPLGEGPHGLLPVQGLDLRQFNPENDPNGNIYMGLAYVITVSLMTVVVGTLFLREPRGAKIWSEVGGEQPGLVTEATPGK